MNIPSQSKYPRPKSSHRYFCFGLFCYLPQGKPAPIKLNQSIRSSIIGLFCCGGPSTIVGAISFRIINSFNRMIGRWSGTHVCEKNSKIIPFFRYSNSALAVPFIVFGCAFASAYEAGPNSVFCRMPHPMSSKSFSVSLSSETSTRFSISAGQIASCDNSVSAAVTSALAHFSSLPINSKQSKLSSNDVLFHWRSMADRGA